MISTPTKQELFTGISLAIITALIWSGNFVMARGIAHTVPPLTLAFFRWGTALVFITPFALKKFIAEWHEVRQHMGYLWITAFSGFTLYNVFLYIAGGYTSAINLALIGSTSAPIFAIVMGVCFFKEKASLLRIAGLLVCIVGIVLLLSNGSWQRLAAFHFSIGDVWTLVGSLCFALYNNLAKHRPAGISPINFLFTGFLMATLMLLPACFIELAYSSIHVVYTLPVISAFLYLGIGCSLLGYLFWNKAIMLIGPGRTVLFGNLIPIFSIIEAVIVLGEKFTTIHLISGLVVMVGLVIANMKFK